MRNFALLAFLLILAACNQNGLGVGAAVRNFLLTPVHAVKGIFTDSAYREERAATLEKSQTPVASELRYCVGADGSAISQAQVSDLETLGQGIMSSVCQCVAWGSCPVSICSCEKQCPWGFEIFRHPVGTRHDTKIFLTGISRARL